MPIKKVKTARERKRQELKKRIKDTTTFRLAFVIAKHLELLFDMTYWCDSEGKDKFVNYSVVFMKYVDTAYDEETDTVIATVKKNLLKEMSKKQLLKLYNDTARATHYLATYHDLNKQIVGTGAETENG